MAELVTAVRIDDARSEPSGTVLELLIGDERRTVRIPQLGSEAVRRAIGALEAALAAGSGLDAALSALPTDDLPRRMQRRRTAAGALLLDDTAALEPDEVRASLRVLADLGRSGFRTLAVVGPLAVEPVERLDAHDALGRIVVRLDIRQLVVVGQEARHLHMAAGLEGSWDGESVLMDDPDTAYDFVRATSGPDTVILVTGGAGLDLTPLVERLSGGAS
ncbi:MAG: glutamate ligase domain-containing protein [Microcella sp.]